ncbi:sigma-70 family RNA polymerase sigma factor [Gammaproteobacteria bacterium]|nr:sigma-70 family RNA polymerase sigma factor [Gammaproteobacteria bacterium]
MLKSRKLSDYEKAKLSEYEKFLLSESLQSKMINMAMLLTKSNEAFSKDLIQQTYLKAIQNKHQFKGDNIDKWVITILKNLFTDSTRKGTFSVKETSRDFNNKKIVEIKKVKRINSYGDDVPEAIVLDESDSVVLERDKDMCLEKLSVNEREIISLKQTDSYDDIADTLDMKSGTIRQIMFRAKEKFMRCMGFFDE